MDSDGQNLKFKREALLNYAINRWGLNKAYSVGPTSELIRSCSPKNIKQWVDYYFGHAKQKKKDGIEITQEYLENLGKKLYVKISEVVQSELELITEEECIDYVFNLVLNRTFEGYKTEIQTIYGQLESLIGQKIEPAPDEWDRSYSVDFYVKVNKYYIGLQIKPISSADSINHYKWEEINRSNHRKFTQKYNGKVFFIYSIKKSGKKTIFNIDVVDHLKDEISRLMKLID